MSLPAVGTRLVIKHELWRYPHFIVRAGAAGVVTHSDEELVALRMDEHIPGAEEWDNEVHWYPRNCDEDPWEDVRVQGPPRPDFDPRLDYPERYIEGPI